MSWAQCAACAPGRSVPTGREPRTRGTGRSCIRGTGGGVCADACGRGVGRADAAEWLCRSWATWRWTGSSSGS